MTNLKSLFAELLSLIGGVSTKLWTLVSPVLQKETGKLMEQLLPIAITYVTSSMTDKSTTSAQKQAAAFSAVKAAAVADGIEATTSVINLVVETAVANVKATTPAVVAPVTHTV